MIIFIQFKIEEIVLNDVAMTGDEMESFFAYLSDISCVLEHVEEADE